jgi:hypothetical protein
MLLHNLRLVEVGRLPWQHGSAGVAIGMAVEYARAVAWQH